MTTFGAGYVLAYILFALVVVVALRNGRLWSARMDAAIAANAPSPEQVAAHYAADAARMTADGLTYDGPGFVRRAS